uniref:Uncharacterized protein n=1 Tax=Ananas comosus var. bracteatus TaxID=296719 RepID=A0A6V7PHT0_ANACO|nr:unnamed protein product [Ananas comosus var. bracteatus]
MTLTLTLPQLPLPLPLPLPPAALRSGRGGRWRRRREPGGHLGGRERAEPDPRLLVRFPNLAHPPPRRAPPPHPLYTGCRVSRNFVRPAGRFGGADDTVAYSPVSADADADADVDGELDSPPPPLKNSIQI